ncbi:MAG: DUF1385 domain-containing protein [Candidatus Woesearchaeota archaeon]
MKDVLVGGMALIEGVMMRGPTKIGIAVRDPKKQIVTKSEAFTPLTQRYKILNIPFIRGSINMVEMMIIGMKSLFYATDVALEEENQSSSWSSWLSMVMSVVIGLGVGLLLFKFIPFFVAKAVSTPTWLALLEGIIKIAIFIGYIYVISKMHDIYRVFQYHGAEHKTIRCFEQKKPLTVRNVKQCSRFHPRCGTSFVIFVILLSIVLYAFIPSTLGFWLQFGIRLALLPVLAGISYEILRITASNEKSVLFSIISAPGVWTQHLTTNEPDDEQIEVAIKALQVALK